MSNINSINDNFFSPNFLKYTIVNSNFDFSIAPHNIIYTNPDSGTAKQYSTSLHSSGPNEDLVLALKLPGPSENSVFIIASFHSLGVPEVIRYLTTKESSLELRKHFESKYGTIPQYFELLFRVVGIDKTAYSTEILISNIIQK